MGVPRFLRFLVLAASFFLGSACLEAQASCPGIAVVQRAATSFILAAQSGTPAAFASAIARHTDMDGIALFALGPYRRDLPPSLRSSYVRKAKQFMSQFLADHARRFEGSELTIESCRGGLVQTSINGGKEMVWRVSGGQVQDVQVSGVWLALELRSKFTDIIRRDHGDVTALLDYLERSTSR